MKTPSKNDRYAALAEPVPAGTVPDRPLPGAWEVIPAIYGAGTMLVGPSRTTEDTPGWTLAVVPPGVWSQTKLGSDREFTRSGWRI